MSNFAPYANHGYLALIKESTAGTAVIPTTFVGLLSESIVPSFAIKSIQTIAGDRERNIRSVPDKIEIAGDVEFFVESKAIGHFLRSLFGAPTTQTLTASTAFRHMFEVSNTPKTYTFDIQPADAPWVHRYYGVMINKLAFSQQDNVIKCTASLTPRKAFINARVTTAANSGTTVAMDQTEGLIAGDSILIIQKEDGYTTVQDRVIASVTNGTSLEVTVALNAQIDVDDIVVIKRQSATYDQSLEFTWLGGTEILTGDDVDNVTAENFEDFKLEFMNETEQRWFAGKTEAARYPGDVLTKGYSASGEVNKFYDSESKLDKARKNDKLGMRVLFEGETATEANVAVKASSTWGATANGFKVEAEAAGKAGNDYNVTLVIASNDTLAASISGNNVTVSLANTTASKNTGTLIASAVNALTGVAGTAEGTGAEQFTVAEANANLGFKSSGTNVVGRDASEKPYMQIDLADVRLDAFFPNASEDNILQQDMPFTVYKDSIGTIKKDWSTRIALVNAVSSY